MLRQEVRSRRNNRPQKPSTTESTLGPWWGPLTLADNESKAFRFGSLCFKISRGFKEWQFEYARPMSQDEFEQDWEVITDPDVFPENAQFERYLFAKTSDTLTLQPRLADRPVAIQPITPIYIPAGEQGVLFVSSPLWMAGYVAGKQQALFDVPVIRPKDSWFGNVHGAGHVCYASNVFGRTSLENVVPRPFRALTAVFFNNRSNRQIQLTRLSIPTPTLQLYCNAAGVLWTSKIIVTQNDSDLSPQIRVSKKPPREADATKPIGEPRIDSSFLFNMFEF